VDAWDIYYHPVWYKSVGDRPEITMKLRLSTPATNVERVIAITERPRGPGVLAVVLGGLLTAGGVGLIARGPSPGFKYGFGLPVLGLGITMTGLGVGVLVHPAREQHDLTPDLVGAASQSVAP
jgi:hypothetical protein